jgi:AraC family L-rhamnose operon transcriptional activator RhaR
MELLTQNDLTIAEIAAACGFDDTKYFSRIFKQSYDISPSHIRSRTHI